MSNIETIPVAPREAAHGEKMIELTVRFWTNNLAEEGQIVPKHAWASGVVKLEPNATHGIDASRPTPFQSLPDLFSKIEQLMIEHGVTLHPSRVERKYRAD
jgi:hypothetical protein